MIIGVDGGCLGVVDERLQVGVYQVAANLLEQLSCLDRRNTYYIYSFTPIENSLLKSFGPRMKNIVVTPARGWMHVFLPMQIAKDKIDIFLALSQVVPTFLPMTKKPKVIGMVHDVTFAKNPEFYPTHAKHNKETRYLVRHTDNIVCVSDATKKDIVQLYQADSKKIVVAYEGVREFPKATGEKVKQFFLFAGALKKQKNIPGLLKAFEQFLDDTDADIDLRIVGGDKWLDVEISNVLSRLSQNALRHVYFEKFVSDSYLAFLYKHAIAFVSPSLSEGFGLPFVEAMSFGCPVIGSSVDALPEVIGKAGVLTNPLNTDAIALEMQKVYKNKSYRQGLSEKGREQAKKFSWSSFATTIFSIIGQYDNS